MELVILGTIGLDDIETPFDKAKNILGGSGVYSAIAASFFVKPGLVSIAGNDLPKENIILLKSKGVDLEGLRYSGKTFQWSGLYRYGMDEAETLKTELNSLLNFKPVLPESYKFAKYLLLSNIDPTLQLETLNQMRNNPFVIVDTMNYWITGKKQDVLSIFKKANLVVINESEARQFFETPNLIKAGKSVLELGPQYAVIKKGEHGALLFSKEGFFSAPSYPLEEVKDPTGAGDSFAGGLIGYLAKTKRIDDLNVRKAVIYGSAIASCCAEAFSLNYTKTIKLKDIEERVNVFKKIRRF
jgi:ribokinase